MTFISVLRFAAARFSAAPLPGARRADREVGTVGNVLATLPLALLLHRVGWAAGFARGRAACRWSPPWPSGCLLDDRAVAAAPAASRARAACRRRLGVAAGRDRVGAARHPARLLGALRLHVDGDLRSACSGATRTSSAAPASRLGRRRGAAGRRAARRHRRPAGRLADRPAREPARHRWCSASAPSRSLGWLASSFVSATIRRSALRRRAVRAHHARRPGLDGRLRAGARLQQPAHHRHRVRRGERRRLRRDGDRRRSPSAWCSRCSAARPRTTLRCALLVPIVVQAFGAVRVLVWVRRLRAALAARQRDGIAGPRARRTRHFFWDVSTGSGIPCQLKELTLHWRSGYCPLRAFTRPGRNCFTPLGGSNQRAAGHGQEPVPATGSNPRQPRVTIAGIGESSCRFRTSRLSRPWASANSYFAEAHTFSSKVYPPRAGGTPPSWRTPRSGRERRVTTVGSGEAVARDDVAVPARRVLHVRSPVG